MQPWPGDDIPGGDSERMRGGGNFGLLPVCRYLIALPAIAITSRTRNASRLSNSSQFFLWCP